ncbi:MAG: D-aspartate ligase [bacterium]|jgi:predicted ATP-grasp superfamily ATP-dependent carboligase
MNTTGSPAAIVLGGAVNAVSIARSLAPDGIEVIALGTGAVDAVRRSRHCRRYVRFRAGAGLQDAWMAWLTQQARRLPDAVLLPAEDEALELIARRRPELEALGYRPFEANDRALLAMLDKGQTADIARQVGIPQPHSLTITDAASVQRALDELGLPLALKPLHSHKLARQAERWGKLITITTREELDHVTAIMREREVDVLATEIIPGGDDQLVSYYSYLDADGEPLLHFCKQQLRAHPPRFGLSSYHRSHWDPEVADAGLRFFRGAGVRGLVNVQFKRDARTGTLMLIECNHRFTAANELVRLSGINLALLTYERALGRPSAPVPDPVDDTRMWDPVMDARSMLAMRRDGQIGVREWLRSLMHRQHMPLMCVDDPGPASVYLAQVARVLRNGTPPAPRP